MLVGTFDLMTVSDMLLILDFVEISNSVHFCAEISNSVQFCAEVSNAVQCFVDVFNAVQ